MNANELVREFEARGFHCVDRRGHFGVETVFLVSTPPTHDGALKVMERTAFIGRGDEHWFIRLTPHGAVHLAKVCPSANEAVQLAVNYLQDGTNPGWSPLMDIDAGELSFTLEDSFLVEERGWILAPAAPVDAFDNNAALTVGVKAPDGSTRSLVGTFMIEHCRLEGGSRWNGAVVLRPDEEAIPAGSRITCAKRSGCE